MKKDYSVLLFQLEFPEDGQSIWSKHRKLSSYQLNQENRIILLRHLEISTEKCPYSDIELWMNIL